VQTLSFNHAAAAANALSLAFGGMPFIDDVSAACPAIEIIATRMPL
jgi:hypothetical protein